MTDSVPGKSKVKRTAGVPSQSQHPRQQKKAMCPSIGVLWQRITLLPFGAFRETFSDHDSLESVTLTLCKWLHDSHPMMATPTDIERSSDDSLLCMLYSCSLLVWVGKVFCSCCKLVSPVVWLRLLSEIFLLKKKTRLLWWNADVSYCIANFFLKKKV